ncbi:hypothetical protein NQZ68_013438 [Dissostichus eleginoides]|nr:hypothetical protein NQZ68_013438 [Dissostichus eleginoides]
MSEATIQTKSERLMTERRKRRGEEEEGEGGGDRLSLALCHQDKYLGARSFMQHGILQREIDPKRPLVAESSYCSSEKGGSLPAVPVLTTRGRHSDPTQAKIVPKKSRSLWEAGIMDCANSPARGFTSLPRELAAIADLKGHRSLSSFYSVTKQVHTLFDFQELNQEPQQSSGNIECIQNRVFTE